MKNNLGSSIRGLCVATAASEPYAKHALALIGSIKCNWRQDVHVVVFDIGLSDLSISKLEAVGGQIIKVPEFCSHWRLHYTWKLWCYVNSPGELVLWLDAGCICLRSLDNVVGIINEIGYFAIPNHFRLSDEISDAACAACGVAKSDLMDKYSIAAGIIGYKKNSYVAGIFHEAFRIGLVENNIKSYGFGDRWEQSVISALFYKNISPLILCDGMEYGFDVALRAHSATKIWAARRTALRKDLDVLCEKASSPNGQYLPKIPRPPLWLVVKFRLLKRKLKLRLNGGYDGVR